MEPISWQWWNFFSIHHRTQPRYSGLPASTSPETFGPPHRPSQGSGDNLIPPILAGEARNICLLCPFSSGADTNTFCQGHGLLNLKAKTFCQGHALLNLKPQTFCQGHALLSSNLKALHCLNLKTFCQGPLAASASLFAPMTCRPDPSAAVLQKAAALSWSHCHHPFCQGNCHHPFCQGNSLHLLFFSSLVAPLAGAQPLFLPSSPLYSSLPPPLLSLFPPLLPSLFFLPSPPSSC